MTSIQIFNVCTHCRDGGGGLSMGIPTPCVLSTHPTNANRFLTGGGDCNAFIWHVSSHSECGLEQIAKLTYHTKQVNTVAWNSTGDECVTSGDDKMIAIWRRDPKYAYDSHSSPAFGESMTFREKWLPQNKIRGPLAEVSDIKYINKDKHIIVASLDGSIGFYHIRKQTHLHTLSLSKNTQFIQGLAIDCTNNLLALQTNSASAKVYKITKNKSKNSKSKNKKTKYTTQLFCSLSYYPYSSKETEQQNVYDEQYILEKKELETNINTNNASENEIKIKKIKIRKKRVAKTSLFKHNLPTTSRQCHWSCDGLLLGMVAGQSKDKSSNCIHVFHRSDLAKKITTLLLPESSHVTCLRFNPLRLELGSASASVDKGSIVDKYQMKYRTLYAIVCGTELFIFDTAKNKGVFYWKDEDTQNFHSMEWSFDGQSLLIADVEGFITRISLSATDLKQYSEINKKETRNEPNTTQPINK